MKALAVVAVAFGTMWMTLPAQAQTPRLTPEQTQRVADQLKQLSGDLNLTSSQRDQLRSVLGDQLTMTDDVRNNTSMSAADKTAKIADIRSAQHTKIANILSPDQLKKWDAAAANIRDTVK